MNQLVGELLELAQLEAKELHLEKDIFQIGEMIQQNLKKNGILFESKKIQITFDSQSEDSVFGDYRKIEHVFNNYIQNAVNHVDEKKQIRITLSSQKGKLRVHVFNSGLPIPQESLDKIWQSFYKVDKARTRAYGGSGLGLSVVKAIMEAHNEAYGVENVADGVTFWFELEQK